MTFFPANVSSMDKIALIIVYVSCRWCTPEWRKLMHSSRAWCRIKTITSDRVACTQSPWHTVALATTRPSRDSYMLLYVALVMSRNSVTQYCHTIPLPKIGFCLFILCGKRFNLRERESLGKKKFLLCLWQYNIRTLALIQQSFLTFLWIWFHRWVTSAMT